MIGHKGNREKSGIRRSAAKGLRALLAVQVLLSTFVVFAPVVSAGPEDDWSEFVFVFDNGTIIAGHNMPGSPYVYPPDGGTRKKNQAWFPGTGGSAGYPTGPGMNVHVSCSDTFENGWGSANQPNQAVDTNWRIASYHIVKYTNGSFTKECGETFTRSSIKVVKNTSPLTDAIFRFGLSGIVPAPPGGGNASFGPDFRNVAGDGDAYTWTGLDAGSYSLVEMVASNPGGYALAGVRCSSDLGADVSPDTDGVTLNLRGGENLTCEFLNADSVPDEPGVDIEKATNGQDADAPTGPQVPVGGVVNWSYVVTNVGDVDLSGVTVEDDQGVVVSCPFDALAVGESMTCTASGTAAAGQYSNVGLVTTDQQVSDQDPSHYFGYIPDEPGVDIEKATNGQDADAPTGPQVPVGGVVNWSYVVTNVGDVDLSGVTVEDDQGVVVSCPFDALAVGESMTCTASGTAAAGQYSNVGLVTTDQQVSDQDPSHYFGYIPDEPGVDIEKATNGQDADAPTGPQVPVGGVVNWSYVVTNVGDVDLSGVTVEDDQGVVVSCPFDALAVGESMTCTASGTAAAGQYSNVGLVTTDQQVSDQDPSHYFGYIPTPNPPTPDFGSIGDFVWDDGLITESNGHQDAGEPGVPGITVNLFNGSGSVKLATTVTNASGGYVFTGLAAGTYVVEFMIPSDTLYSFTAANRAGSYLTDSDSDPLTRRTGVITLGVGENDMSWDAGLVVPAVLPQVITTVATVGQTAETLPFTGSSSRDMAGLGLALLALGSLAILVVRRREDEQRVTGGGSPFSVAYRGRHRRS